jgi:hypothetical protein
MRRAAPVLCGCALAAGAVYVAVNDPGEASSRFPACPFHTTTGLWCPGCGLTRGTHHLLNGNIAGSLGMNVFTPLIVGAIVVVWWRWTTQAWGRTGSEWRMPNWVWVAFPALLITFGVARNLPWDPVRWLAPT